MRAKGRFEQTKHNHHDICSWVQCDPFLCHSKVKSVSGGSATIYLLAQFPVGTSSMCCGHHLSLYNLVLHAVNMQPNLLGHLHQLFLGFFGNGIRSSTNHVHRFFLIDASFLFGTFKHVSFFGYIFSTSIELEAFAQSTSDRNLKLNWPGSLFSTCFPQLIIEVIVAKKWPQTSGWVCNFTCCCFKWPKLYMPRCRTVAQPLTT